MADSRTLHYRRLGILGGGFDPVHRGHVQIALELFQLAQFDHLLIVPSFHPPHKPLGCIASFDARLEMARMAFSDMKHCTVTDLESRISGPSFSIELVRIVKRTFAADTYCLCLGADQFSDLPNWREPALLAREVTFCVARRPGESFDQPSFAFAIHAEFYTTSLIDISASQIRSRLRQGMSESDCAQLVPDSVARYIAVHGLYR